MGPLLGPAKHFRQIKPRSFESARAGEAGRGFAVVAAEVKNLANQAEQATDKIEQEIGKPNGISDDVVAALTSIKNAIQDVSEYVTSTAAPVERQSAVTGGMSTSMQRAAVEAAAIGGQASRTVHPEEQRVVTSAP